MAEQIQYTLCPMCGQKIRAGVDHCPGCGKVFYKPVAAVKPAPAVSMKAEAKAPAAAPAGTVCPGCGKQVREGARFCPFCATRLEKGTVRYICPKCGNEAPEGEKYCSQCGVAYVATVLDAAPMVDATPERTEEPQLSREAFFEKHATGATKGWAKWMPILGLISAGIYLIMMGWMFSMGNTVSGVFMIFDVLCIGGLSYGMLKSRKPAPFIGFAVYNGIATVLAFFDMDFSNLLWLIVSIYLAVKMYKIEKAYSEYEESGTEPAGRI